MKPFHPFKPQRSRSFSTCPSVLSSVPSVVNTKAEAKVETEPPRTGHPFSILHSPFSLLLFSFLLFFLLSTHAQNPGNALAFDGTDDHVVMPDNDETITTAFTLETWVMWQPNDVTDVNFIGGKANDQMEIHTGGGAGANGLRFIPTTGVWLDAANVLPTGTWTHVACTYNATASAAHIYINGSEVAATSTGTNQVGTALQSTETGFYLGSRSYGFFFMRGSLDEFRIWNRALSQTEIQQNLFASIDPATSTGLVGYYNFNTGTAGADNSGLTILNDLTGSYNGTLTNFALTGSTSNWVTSDATVYVPGEPGNALAFDGTDDHVVMPDNDASITTAFTLETWVLWQPDAATDVQFLCGKAGEQMEIHTGGGAGANGLRFIPTTGVYLEAANVLPTGTWTHVACTYDASASAAHMYINGSEVTLTNNGSNPLGTALQGSTISFYLGRRSDGSYLLKGRLDEFRLYDRVLTQAEIQQNWNTTINPATQTGLVSYYNFNQGTSGGDNSGSTTLTDLTGNFNGTLTNFALSGATSNWVASGATVYLPSVPGNALNFDGADDYVAIPDNGTDPTDYTLTTWVRQTTAGLQFICGKGVGTMEIHTTATHGLRFIPGNSVFLDVDNVLPPGIWTHVAIAYNPSAASAHIYINGQEVPYTLTGSLATLPTNNTTPYNLGRRSDGSYPFNGSLDEFALFNSALSQGEIQTLMTGGASSMSPAMYYTFNQGTAGADNTAITSLFDYSGNINTGTLTNFALSGATSNWVESYAMVIAESQAATDISETGFTANWQAATYASLVENYLLEVATDTAFTSLVSAYNPATVANTETSLAVSVTTNQPYYYRMRPEKTSVSGQAAWSQVQTIEPVYAYTTADSATAVLGITATVNASVKYLGATAVTAHGVCWNTTGAPTTDEDHTDLGAATESGTFTAELTGLSENTMYYARAYATNSSGTSYSNLLTFTTRLATPDITTNAVTDITLTTATGNLTIGEYTGTSGITDYGICWGTASGPTVEANTGMNHTEANAAPGDYSFAITGLSINTTYYVRAYAANAGGTAYGNEVSFTTFAEGEPTVETRTASNVSIPGYSHFSATFNGMVNPNNTGNYEVWFEYIDENYYNNYDGGIGGFDPAHTLIVAASPAIVSGNSDVPVSADIDYYHNFTCMHYRLKVIGPNGTYYGRDCVAQAFDVTRSLLFVPRCSDSPTLANFDLVNYNNNAVALEYVAGSDYSGSLTIPGPDVETIYVGKNLIVSFSYANTLFLQWKTNNQTCSVLPDAWARIFIYRLGWIKSSGAQLYKILNTYTAPVTITVDAGTEQYTYTIAKNSTAFCVTGNADAQLSIDGMPFGISSSSPFTYEESLYLELTSVSATKTTATFQLYNRDDASHTWVFRNAAGLEYSYTLAGYESQSITLSNEVWGVYITVYDALTKLQSAYPKTGPTFGNPDYALNDRLKIATATPAEVSLLPTLLSLAQNSANSIIANGTINAHSEQSETTEYYFMYGTDSTNLDQSTAPQQITLAAGEDASVSGTLTGLTPGTVYYCRLVSASMQSNRMQLYLVLPTANLHEPGNTLNFDGTDDYVAIPDYGADPTTYTMAAWVRWTTATAGIQFICSKGVGHIEIHTSATNGLRFIPAMGTFLDVDNMLPLGIWTHIAVVYDHSAASAHIYINGQEVSYTLTGSLSTLPTDNATSYNLGRRSDGTYCFNGSIDEFSIWDRALSQSEIRAVMTEGVPYASPIFCSAFNSGTAGDDNTVINVLTDDSGNWNNGILNNFALTGSTSNWVESYAMVVPTATAATNVTYNSFTANWTAPQTGTFDNYLLYVATDSSFTSPVSGYNPKIVDATATSETLTGLSGAANYYYRLKADKSSVTGQGAYSNTRSGTVGGMAMHLRADQNVTLAASLVTGWNDISGNGNNATQIGSYDPTFAEDAINGQPAVHFNGASALYLPTSTSLGIQNHPYELFIVARTASTDVQYLISGAHYYTLSDLEPEYSLNDQAGARFTPVLSTYIDKGTAGSYTNGSAHIFSARASATGGAVRVDGIDGETSNSFLLSSYNNTFSLGAKFNGTGFFNGDIAEVIVYNKILSEYERDSVEQYLANRYNIPISASTYQTAGNWSVAENWSNGLPTSEISAIVDANCTVDGNYEAPNLTINSGKVLTIAPNQTLTVNGTLTNHADSTGLVIQSTASGTGCLINGTSGVRASVQQFIAEDKWHYMGIPFAGTPTVVPSLKGLWVSGCDEQTATHGSTEGWAYLQPSDLMNSGSGFGVYHDLDTTVTIYGTLNAGGQTVPVSWKDSDHGWNLISNPFPCVVDWDYVRTNSGLSGVNDAIYVYDAANASYATYIDGVSAGSATQDRYIAPMQGFLVRSTAAGSVTFSENAKSTGAATFKSSAVNQIIRLEVSASTGLATDNTVIRIAPQSTNQFDGKYDAYKLLTTSSLTPQLYSVLNGVDYSINSIPEITSDLIIPLEVMVRTTGEHILSLIQLENYTDGYPINIFSKKGEVLANLDTEDYGFDAKEGDVVSFYLGFSSTMLGVNNLVKNNTFLSTIESYLWIKQMGNVPSEVSIINVTGQEVFRKHVCTNELMLQLPVSGIYIVNVKQENRPVFNGKAVINF